jgi:hypothetical protein
MVSKETRQLYDEVLFSDDIFKFVDENEAEQNIPIFHEHLEKMLIIKGKKKTDVLAKACLNPIYGYHIFSGLKNPSRDKVLQLAFGFQLDVSETQSLLKIARQPVLYARDKRDSVILFCLSKSLSVIDALELLDQLELEPLACEK